VETIRDRKPNATIVLHSILPRGEGTLASSDADDYISPLWLETVQLNQRLECYASGEPRVEFVNTTDLFITNDDKSNKVVNQALMEDYIHPTAEGYQIFGVALVERALEMLTQLE
jgi:lysophospholipase L1-like esterase